MAHAESTGISSPTQFEFDSRPREPELARPVAPQARRRTTRRLSQSTKSSPPTPPLWPQAAYEPGHGQPSFDKQYVRDYSKRFSGTRSRGPLPARRRGGSGAGEIVEAYGCCRVLSSIATARRDSARTPRAPDGWIAACATTMPAASSKRVHHPRPERSAAASATLPSC